MAFVYNNEELEVFQVFDTANDRAMHRFVRHLSSFGKVVSPMDFKPKTALIVTKVSRYEFERHKHKELSEIDFEHLLTNRGSDYTMIRLDFLSFLPKSTITTFFIFKISSQYSQKCRRESHQSFRSSRRRNQKSAAYELYQ